MKTLAVLLMLVAVPASAEPTPFRWGSHRAVAGRLSDAAVWAAITAETVHSLRAEHRTRALGCQGLRLGVTTGAAVLTKRLIHRERPDGSDWQSFYSQHTASAMTAAGWKYSVGIPIAVGAGYFRMAADKHYLSDVAAGAVAGFLVGRVCR